MPAEGRYAATDAMVREVRRLHAKGGVTPGPVQDPLPDLAGLPGPAGSPPRGPARRAAAHRQRRLVGSRIVTALQEAGHDPAVGRMAGGIQAWVTDDPERDWPRVKDHLAYQQDSYRRHMVEGTDQPVPTPIDPEKLIRREPRGPLGYLLVRDARGHCPADPTLHR